MRMLTAGSRTKCPPCRRRRPQAGITVFELMVVMLIAGTLAVLGLLSAQGIFTRTKISRVQQDHQTIARALENYFLDYGMHPPASVGLSALVRPTAYLGRVPSDPFQSDNAPYLYVPIEQPELAYLLVSAGPNGKLELPADLIRHGALHEAGAAATRKLQSVHVPAEGGDQVGLAVQQRDSANHAFHATRQAIWTPGLPLSDVDLAILRTYLSLGQYDEERGGDGDIVFAGRN